MIAAVMFQCETEGTYMFDDPVIWMFCRTEFSAREKNCPNMKAIIALLY